MVAAVACCTSGGVVRDGIAGVGQLHPKPSVHILLDQWVDEKTAESIQGHNGLHEVQALHVECMNEIPTRKQKYA